MFYCDAPPTLPAKRDRVSPDDDKPRIPRRIWTSIFHIKMKLLFKLVLIKPSATGLSNERNGVIIRLTISMLSHVGSARGFVGGTKQNIKGRSPAKETGGDGKKRRMILRITGKKWEGIKDTAWLMKGVRSHTLFPR